MFKAAGLNAGLIAQLSCVCDLPQLASQRHRAHAVCVCVCVLSVYLRVVIVYVPFNVCVLMSAHVRLPEP